MTYNKSFCSKYSSSLISFSDSNSLRATRTVSSFYSFSLCLALLTSCLSFKDDETFCLLNGYIYSPFSATLHNEINGNIDKQFMP